MEHPDNNVRETFIGLLRTETECANSLFQVLKSESTALGNADFHSITENGNQKLELINQLQQASAARINFMQHHELSVPATAEEAEASNLPTSDPELNALFIQLSDLARRCYNENRIIGQLINRRTQFISRVLNKLSPSSRNDALTYKENGATAFDNQSALLDLTNV